MNRGILRCSFLVRTCNSTLVSISTRHLLAIREGAVLADKIQDGRGNP
ncbi:unnamed protein product [Discosporangium mesarthrocarpum]